MAHDAKIVDRKQITNELTSYRIVCCGQVCSPLTCRPDAHRCEDSWHVMSIHIDDHTPKLDEYKRTVEARHAKMEAWHAKEIPLHTLPK